MIAHIGGVGREADHLQVGERGLEGEGDHDRRGDGVPRHHDVVKRMTAAEHRPVLGMLGLVGPVVLAVEVDQLVREEELQLGVPQLVEHAVDRHVAHRGRRAEAGHPRLELAGLILRQRHGAVVQLEHAGPAFVGLFVELGARQCRLHRVGSRILLALDGHIFAVRDLVGLVEGLPLLDGDAVGIAHLGRKERLPRHVGGRPVGIPRNIVPLGTLEHRRHSDLPFAGHTGAPRRLAAAPATPAILMS